MKNIINDNIFTTELDCNDAQSVLQLLYKFKDYINKKVKGQGTFLYYLNDFIQNISITNNPTPHLLPVYNDNGRLKSNLPSEPNDVVTNETPSVVFAESERQKSKNLLPINNFSGTLRYQQYLSIPLKAGTYTISGKVVSSDTDSSVCLIDFMNILGNSIKPIWISRDIQNFYVFTLEEDCYLINFYGSNGYEASEGDTFTYSNMQIEVGKQATDYQPYNGEIVHEKGLNTKEIVYDLLNNRVNISASQLTTLREYFDLFNMNNTKTYYCFIGTLNESNFKNLVGNPTGFGNYTQSAIRLISKGNHLGDFITYEIIAFDNYSNKIAKGYIWSNVNKEIVFTGWHIIGE